MGSTYSSSLKQDRKSVRICGDFSVTVNPVSKLDRYPIPKIEDLFARLSNGKYYTKIDLSHAYQQLLDQRNTLSSILTRGYSDIHAFHLEFRRLRGFFRES